MKRCIFATGNAQSCINHVWRSMRSLQYLLHKKKFNFINKVFISFVNKLATNKIPIYIQHPFNSAETIQNQYSRQIGQKWRRSSLPSGCRSDVDTDGTLVIVNQVNGFINKILVPVEMQFSHSFSETYAMAVCAKEIIDIEKTNEHVFVCSDSHATLKAPSSSLTQTSRYLAYLHPFTQIKFFNTYPFPDEDHFLLVNLLERP